MNVNPYLLVVFGFVLVFAFGWYYFNDEHNIIAQSQSHPNSQAASLGKRTNALQVIPGN